MSRLRYNVAKIVLLERRVDIVLTQRQMHLFLLSVLFDETG